jgi:hypothetical protein
MADPITPEDIVIMDIFVYTHGDEHDWEAWKRIKLRLIELAGLNLGKEVGHGEKGNPEA